MQCRFEGRVAIVTGAGRGLGRSHVLALAARGACVVVNDADATIAETTAADIVAAGGEAVACVGSVVDPAVAAALAATATERWGRVDILVNNAGILRDRSFGKMTAEEFSDVMQVHVMGAFHCTKAVWDTMRSQRYGRVVMTTSSSGLYGNFGQVNYGAAKMALVGMMQTLALEGERYGIRVNCLAPTAATAMTEGLMSAEASAQLVPEAVTPALLALVAEDAPTRTTLCAGAGHVGRANITLTQGCFIGSGLDAPDQVLSRLEEISARDGELVPASGSAQRQVQVASLAASQGLP